MPALALVLGLVGVVIGVIGAYVIQQGVRRNRVQSAERSAARILNEADRRQKEILLEAKEEAIKFRQQAESELRERRTEVQREIRDDANRLLREIEQEVKEGADERARKIIATTMQRLTTDVVSENTVSIVPIPSEDMKGRIIGREGRNIRSLEHAT